MGSPTRQRGLKGTHQKANAYQSWTLPIVESKIDSLVTEILQSTIERGTKNSLTAKLNAAKKQLVKNNLGPAINQIETFRNEVAAQKGKTILTTLAERWEGEALTVLAALRSL